MKWENKLWHLVSFLVGSFVCYLTLQVSFFEIKKELDIPNIILSIITLIIGLFIAITLQKRINKGQNQYSYISNKLDAVWNSFNDFSEKISYDNKMDISSIRVLIKEVIRPTSFMKHIFGSFKINDTCICDLEEKLDAFETKLSDCPAENNIIDISSEKGQIENMVLGINICFLKILNEIQEL
jgi:hypothetical protein